MFNKKGQMTGAMLGLVTVGIIFVVFGITLAIGQSIVGGVGASYAANTFERNATTQAQTGMQTLTGQTNNLALIAILTVIIAALFGALGFILARRNA